MLERNLDGLDDRAHRFGEAFGDLPFADHNFLRHAVHQVAPLYLHDPPLPVLRHAGGTDFRLDALGAALADQEIVVTPDISDDRLVHLVAAHPNRPAVDDAAEREHRDLRGAAADIDDHRAARLRHRQTSADRCRHWLLDQKYPPGAGAFRGFLDRPPLHRGRPGRNAHDDLRGGKAAAVVQRMKCLITDTLASTSRSMSSNCVWALARREDG